MNAMWPAAGVMLLLSAMAMAQQPQQLPAQMYAADGTPKSDPTALTTQAQKDSTAALEKYVLAKIEALHEDMKRALAGLEKADERQTKRLDEVPALIAGQVSALKALMDQQFAGQIGAVGKAENATTNRMDGIGAIITANAKSTDDKIDGVRALLASQVTELRNSVNEIRTTTASITSRGAGQSDLWAYIAAAAGLFIAAVSFILRRADASPQPQPQPQPPPNWYPPPQYQQPQYQQPPPPPQVSVVPVVPVAVPAK